MLRVIPLGKGAVEPLGRRNIGNSCGEWWVGTGIFPEPCDSDGQTTGPKTSPGRAPGKDPYSWSSIPEHEDGKQRTISKLNRILPRACKVMEVKDKFNSENSSRNTHPPVTVMARLLA